MYVYMYFWLQFDSLETHMRLCILKVWLVVLLLQYCLKLILGCKSMVHYTLVVKNTFFWKKCSACELDFFWFSIHCVGCKTAIAEVKKRLISTYKVTGLNVLYPCCRSLGGICYAIHTYNCLFLIEKHLPWQDLILYSQSHGDKMEQFPYQESLCI